MSIDPRFIVQLKGRDYPTFAGALDAATRAGLKSLIITLVQIPSPENGQMAVVMARAEFEDERVFEDVGDCSPQSTSPQLAAASLRLASTRAKGRVLRDAVNVGSALLEELGDVDAIPEGPRGEATPAANGKTEAPVCSAVGCGKVLTPGQAEVSRRNCSGTLLCPAHQKQLAARPN